MKNDDQISPVPIKDADIKTEQALERRSFLSRAGFFLIGASALVLSSGATGHSGSIEKHTSEESDRKDSDVNKMADSHLCDSDKKDAACDHDMRKFRDPKSKDKD